MINGSKNNTPLRAVTCCINLIETEIRAHGGIPNRKSRSNELETEPEDGAPNCFPSIDSGAIDYRDQASDYPSQDNLIIFKEYRDKVLNLTFAPDSALGFREKQVLEGSLDNMTDSEMAVDGVPLRQVPVYRQRAICKLKKSLF